MRQNKERNRKSIRLKGYNYSLPGFYFITICVKGRECLFGEIVDGIMLLNKNGNIAQHFWNQMGNGYENIHADAFVIMPNHVHGIIEIKKGKGFSTQPVRAIHELPLPVLPRSDEHESIKKQRRKMLIPKIVGRYKMNVAKQINIQLGRTGAPFWQRNYYEHIIRDEESLFRIREYIKQNPSRWNNDRFHFDD